MHTEPMPDSAGEFGKDKQSDEPCRRKCENPNVRERLWESSCGGYEDYQYRCLGCGATWWVEGPDS